MATPQPARKQGAPRSVSTLKSVERKLASVLFVDLVDSTGLVTTVDPEVVRRRVNGFFEQVQQCVDRHGGIVEKFAGDAVMAAFGIPQAHEDDAERAIRTALAIMEFTTDLGLEARAGINDDEPVRSAFEKLRACCEDEAVADLLAVAAGLLEAVEDEKSPQEIAWAAREWASKLAHPQPLVLVFEDIHWGEEPLHELIEHIAEFVRDAPLFIVVLARPELLEVRPSWGG